MTTTPLIVAKLDQTWMDTGSAENFTQLGHLPGYP